jgi:hypothetical protein
MNKKILTASLVTTALGLIGLHSHVPKAEAAPVEYVCQHNGVTFKSGIGSGPDCASVHSNKFAPSPFGSGQSHPEGNPSDCIISKILLDGEL